MKHEKTFAPKTGWGPLCWILILFVTSITTFVMGIGREEAVLIVGALIGFGAAVIGVCGFMPVPRTNPECCCCSVSTKERFGRQAFWVNPFFSKRKLSLRIRNFETGSTSTPEEKNQAGQVVKQSGRTPGKPSKVNDRDGNPVDISAVVVWKVVDTAEALFEVDDFEHFVEVQSEAALRDLASRHPYDSNDGTISLRGNPDDVCETLKADIQSRLDSAGVEVVEARLSHLAYAQEIAAAMLQRQQAQAVVSARTKIVEGAVGMVEMALEELHKNEIVELDEERKATMVSNLLVVLCSDRATQPVVNAGSLY